MRRYQHRRLSYQRQPQYRHRRALRRLRMGQDSAPTAGVASLASDIATTSSAPTAGFSLALSEDKLLDEVERNIDYLSKFKSSSICAPAIKMLKENLVSSISQSNGFNIEDNYFEVSTITFAVAGCIDALIEPLPVFNKEELGRAIVSMLKSSKN